MISKKKRFDIFKRDGFKCQYCGRTPPDIILEIDHIIPKYEGGKDNIHNYITACFDCNRGKGETSLATIPDTLAQKLNTLKEKYKQLKAYNNYLQKTDENLEVLCYNVVGIFYSHFRKYNLSDKFVLVTIKTFLTKLPELKVKEAMSLSCSKFNDPHRVLKYFCGICWNFIKSGY